MTSLTARAVGVIRSPRATLAAVAATPRWLDVLVLTTIIGFLANAALFQTEVGKLALLDQWERTAIAFNGSIGPEQYAELQAMTEQGAIYALITALASGPLLVFGLSAVLIAVLRGLLHAQATFTQVLAIVSHAGVVLALRQAVAAPMAYASESLASPTSLVRFAGVIDESSPLARFLGVIDLFVVWWIVALAVGIAALAHRRVRPVALAFTGAYVVLAVLLAITMALTGGVA